MKLRATAPVAAALAVAERWAVLDGQRAAVEANRQAAIAATNAVADGLAAPLIVELDALGAELDGWFRRNVDQVTGGKRRSAELGGCMLSLRAGKVRLAIAVDDKAAVAALQAHRWAKPLVRVSYAVDRMATLKALAGKHAGELTALGFVAEDPGDAFTLARVEQPGVATPA